LLLLNTAFAPETEEANLPIITSVVSTDLINDDGSKFNAFANSTAFIFHQHFICSAVVAT
jgi:hypothetical protein